MAFKAISLFFLLAGSALADKTFPIHKTGNDGLNCRTAPNTGGAIKKSYPSNGKVTITCQTKGENVNGHNVWDRTKDGCYVADYYVKTGTDKYVVAACDGGSKPKPKPPTSPANPPKGAPKIPTNNCKQYVIESGYTTLKKFPGVVHTVWCYANKAGEHGKGRALDFMVKPRSKEGLQLAEWVMNNHKSLKVMYVIWEQRIWNIQREQPRPWSQWRKMEDRGSCTQNHCDHIHVSYL